MRHQSSITTEHRVTLDPAEWFTIKAQTSRLFVLEVDQITVGGFEIENGESRWEIVCRGHKILKSGARGALAKMGSWEHSGGWTDENRVALWDALPDSVKAYLTTLGVFA